MRTYKATITLVDGEVFTEQVQAVGKAVAYAQATYKAHDPETIASIEVMEAEAEETLVELVGSYLEQRNEGNRLKALGEYDEAVKYLEGAIETRELIGELYTQKEFTKELLNQRKQY